MPIYLGNTAVKVPYAKAYLGSNLIYKDEEPEPHEGTYFNSSLAPTSWSVVTAYTDYTASNTYGTWEIKSSSTQSSSYALYKAFDAYSEGSTSQWSSTSMDEGDVSTCEIDCPVLISPTKITLTQFYFGDNSYLQGYNPSTNNWENLGQIQSVDSATTQIFDISTNNFYSKFRTYGTRYNNLLAGSKNRVINFKIIEGYYK